MFVPKLAKEWQPKGDLIHPKKCFGCINDPVITCILDKTQKYLKLPALSIMPFAPCSWPLTPSRHDQWPLLTPYNPGGNQITVDTSGGLSEFLRWEAWFNRWLATQSVGRKLISWKRIKAKLSSSWWGLCHSVEKYAGQIALLFSKIWVEIQKVFVQPQPSSRFKLKGQHSEHWISVPMSSDHVLKTLPWY